MKKRAKKVNKVSFDLREVKADWFVSTFGKDSKEWKQAEDACRKSAIPIDLWQLDLEDLRLLMEGKRPNKIQVSTDLSVWEYFLLIRVGEFVQEFFHILEGFTIKQSVEEQIASNGLPKLNGTEGILIFVRSYFGLRSFSDAEKITLADVYLAKKDAYIQGMFERRYNKQIENKYKVKK